MHREAVRPSRRSRVLPLLALLPWLLAAGCGGGGQAVTVEPGRHDFGRVMEGDVRAQSFRITNRGDRSTGITVHANCRCLQVSQKTLAALDPGETTEFTVRFVTTALPPQRLQGKYVIVHTDLPNGLKIVVPFEGEIFRAYTMSPRHIDLGRIDGEPRDFAPREVVLRPQGCRAVHLSGFRATPDVFDVAGEPSADGGLTVGIRLREGTQRPLGRFLAQVRLDLELTLPGGERRQVRPLVEVRGFWDPR